MPKKTEFLPAQGNGPLLQVKEGVWSVEGHFTPPALKLKSFSLKRTMAIARMPDQSLMIFNPLRLTADVQDELDRLGNISAIVTLGSGHGADTPFYKARYSNANFWDARSLAESTPPNVELFKAPGDDKEVDYICYVPHTKILVTCDAVHNYPKGSVTSGGCNMSCGGRHAFPLLGLKGELVTPPLIFKSYGIDKKAFLAMCADVMTRDFDTIICAHGPAATGNVKERWSASLAANPKLKGL